MRLLTGPVCIVDQTAPKTTPRPTPREASRIHEVRTQLAPAEAGGGRRGDGVRFKGVVVASRLGACVWCGRRRRAAAMCKLGALLSRSISGARVCARRVALRTDARCDVVLVVEKPRYALDTARYGALQIPSKIIKPRDE